MSGSKGSSGYQWQAYVPNKHQKNLAPRLLGGKYMYGLIDNETSAALNVVSEPRLLMGLVCFTLVSALFLCASYFCDWDYLDK